MTGTARDLDGTFFAESRDLLTTAIVVLESFDAVEAADNLRELHRCAHSLKGAALMLDFDGFGQLAGALAGLLESMQALEADRVTSMMPLVQEGFETIQVLLDELTDGTDRHSGNESMRLRLVGAACATPEPLRRIVFRLSPVALVSPFLVEDMLDELRAVVRVVNAKLDVTSGHESCWVELPSSENLGTAMAAIERVADPGSARVEEMPVSEPVDASHDRSKQPLLRAPVQSDSTSEQAENAAPTHQQRSTAAASERCLTLQLGARWFAVRAETVDAVAAESTIDPYPVGEPGMMGVVEIAGRYARVFDLRVCLGLGHFSAESGMQIITSLGNERVGVQVDRVEDIIDVSGESLQGMNGLKQPGIEGVTRYHGAAVWVLDLPALLAGDVLRQRARSQAQYSRDRDDTSPRGLRNDELAGVVSAYGAVFDDALRVRALALNLALIEMRNSTGLLSGLVGEGLTLMHSLSARLDVLGGELLRLADGCDAVATGSEQATELHVIRHGDNMKEDAQEPAFQSGAKNSPRHDGADAATPRDEARPISRAPAELPSRLSSLRRPRASSTPVPRIGRGRNPLKEQWSG